MICDLRFAISKLVGQTCWFALVLLCTLAFTFTARADNGFSNIVATITITNTSGTTNGNSFKMYVGSNTNGYNYVATNVWPSGLWPTNFLGNTNVPRTGFHYFAATNTHDKAATNLYVKLKVDWTNVLFISLTASNVITIKTKPNELLRFTNSITPGWGTITWTTNLATNNSSLASSNITAKSITLNGTTISAWTEVTAGAGAIPQTSGRGTNNILTGLSLVGTLTNGYWNTHSNANGGLVISNTVTGQPFIFGTNGDFTMSGSLTNPDTFYLRAGDGLTFSTLGQSFSLSSDGLEIAVPTMNANPATKLYADTIATNATNYAVGRSLLNTNHFSATTLTNIRSDALVTNLNLYGPTLVFSNTFVYKTNFANYGIVSNHFHAETMSSSNATFTNLTATTISFYNPITTRFLIHGTSGLLTNEASSAALLATLTNETGTGVAVFNTNAALYSPTLISAVFTNTTFRGTNTVSGDWAGNIGYITTVANGNNTLNASNYTTIIITGTPTAAWNINAIEGGREGRELLILAQTTNILTWAHESGFNADVTTRLRTVGYYSDLAVGTNSAALLRYSNSRWLVMPFATTNGLTITVASAIASTNGTGYGTTLLPSATAGLQVGNLTEYFLFGPDSAIAELYTNSEPAEFFIGVTEGGHMKLHEVASLGDVTGPGSVSDNAVALFDGTSGDLLKQHVGEEGKFFLFSGGIWNNSVNGSTLEDLNASEVTSGTLPAARLDGISPNFAHVTVQSLTSTSTAPAGILKLGATNTPTLFFSLQAPTNLTTNVNIIGPNAPTNGLFYGTITDGTNVTLTQITNGTGCLSNNGNGTFTWTPISTNTSGGGSGTITGGTNLGTGTFLFAGTNAAGQIQFNSVAVGTGLGIASNNNTLTLSVTNGTLSPVATNTGAFGVVYTNDSTKAMMVTASVKTVAERGEGGEIKLLSDATGAPTTVRVIGGAGTASTVTTGEAVVTNYNTLTYLVSPGGSYQITTNNLNGTCDFTFTTNIQETLIGIGASPSTVGYTLQFDSETALNPADSTTYYTGTSMGRASETTYNFKRVHIPKAGTVKSMYLKVLINTTLGSSELSTNYLYLNGTTAFGHTTMALDASLQDCFTNGLNQAVAAGDYIAIATAMPVFATNPTSLRFWGMVYIE